MKMGYKPIKPSYRAFKGMHTDIRQQIDVSSVDDIARAASLLMAIEGYLDSPAKSYLKQSSQDYIKMYVQYAKDNLRTRSKREGNKEKFDYWRRIVRLNKKGIVTPATTGDLAEAIYQIAEKEELFNTGLRALMYLETKCSEEKTIPQLVIKLVEGYKNHILENPTIKYKQHEEKLEADLERITKKYAALMPNT